MTKKVYYLILLVTLLASALFIGNASTLSIGAILAKSTDVVPLSNILHIAASGVYGDTYSGTHYYSEHSCALTTSRGVKCWGHNGRIRVGDMTGVNEPPISVSGLSSDIAAIAMGAYHTCALTTNGGILCWGENFSGQLGNGGGIGEGPPVSVSGLSSGVMAIAANGAQTCALTVGGSVLCWGATVITEPGPNPFWQSTPVPVAGLNSDIIAITVGNSNTDGHMWQPGHLCALTTQGAVKCWGKNYYGQLGDGTTEHSNMPVDVQGLGSGVAAIAAGAYHACALMTNGSVMCWGNNAVGQLGNDTSMKTASMPVPVQGLSSSVTAITAGNDHTCAVMTNGGVECWGANSYGQLGNGTTAEVQSTPVPVSNLSSVVAIAAGARHTCALTTTGTVKCWGYDILGQLEDGNLWSTTPVDIMEEEPPLATPTFTPTALDTQLNTPTNTSTPLATVTPLNTPIPEPTHTPTPEPTVLTVRVEGQVIEKDTQIGVSDVLITLTDISDTAVEVNSLISSSASLTTSEPAYTTTTTLNGSFVFPTVKFGTYKLIGLKTGNVIESLESLVINGEAALQLTALSATKENIMLYLPLVTK